MNRPRLVWIRIGVTARAERTEANDLALTVLDENRRSAVPNVVEPHRSSDAKVLSGEIGGRQFLPIRGAPARDVQRRDALGISCESRPDHSAASAIRFQRDGDAILRTRHPRNEPLPVAEPRPQPLVA